MMTLQVPLEIRRHQLVSKVREVIQNRDVVVGVSGGGDSIALLLLCIAASMQQESSFSIIAGHIHHGLREASDDELVRVEGICERLGITCVVKKIDVQKKDGSLAAGARVARYEALCAIAIEHNMSAIAVAHHAEDQLETMLMAMCRGGGMRKLAGMMPSRELTDSIHLIRPLLHADKATLLEICSLAQIEWCEDPTNSDCSTPRGKLRQDVIPILRELWPAADRHAANAASLLHPAIDAFDESILAGTSWSRESLNQLAPPAIAATVHRAVGTHATFETVQSITSAIVDGNTNPRTFVCCDGCVVNVTAHLVEVVYT
jgi:tRNA(Ile)-lysidine synthetase-like protein